MEYRRKPPTFSKSKNIYILNTHYRRPEFSFVVIDPDGSTTILYIYYFGYIDTMRLELGYTTDLQQSTYKLSDIKLYRVHLGT